MTEHDTLTASLIDHHRHLETLHATARSVDPEGDGCVRCGATRASDGDFCPACRSFLLGDSDIDPAVADVPGWGPFADRSLAELLEAGEFHVWLEDGSTLSGGAAVDHVARLHGVELP